MVKKIFLSTVLFVSTGAVFAAFPQADFWKKISFGKQTKSSASRAANNTPECVETFYYNEDTHTWESDGKTHYIYDSHGNPITTIDIEADDTTHISYTYDANGNKTSAATYYWDSIQWTTDDSTVYTYDSSGHLTSETHLYFDGENWQESDVVNYSNFDANGNPTTLAYSSSDESYTLRGVYTYDSNGNITQKKLQYNTGIWIDMYRETNTYDADGTKTSTVTENFDMESMTWVYSDKTVYSCETSGIYPLSDNRIFQLYPNPSNGKFAVTSAVLNGGEVAVFNITGEKIYSQNVSSFAQTEIDVVGQPAGVYILKIITEKNVWTKPLVIK